MTGDFVVGDGEIIVRRPRATPARTRNGSLE